MNANDTVDTIAHGELHVVMLWDWREGFYYVGPFADAEAAGTWGSFSEVLTQSLCWQPRFVDPRVPLEIRTPDAADLDPYSDPWSYRWEAPQSNTPGAAYHLLMTDSDPLHLVGPFTDHRAACAWGRYNEEERDRDYGWQLVWLEHPTAPVPLLSCKQVREKLLS